MATEKQIKAFLDLAKKRLSREVKADSDNRTAAISCLNFLLPENQWDQKERSDRATEGRPCLTLPMLPKFVAQVVGDMLHSRARVSIKPVDSKSDPHIAKIRQGIISNTEYISNGEDIYLEAGKMQVASGYGAWRINTRYCEDDPFLQEIYLELIPNPFNVYLDSRRKDAAGADAKFGFIITKMPKDEFEEQWPKAKFPAQGEMKTGVGQKDELWYDNETVTVAEYFVVEEVPQVMCQLTDNTVMSEEDFKELVEAWETERKEQVDAIQGMAAGGDGGLGSALLGGGNQTAQPGSPAGAPPQQGAMPLAGPQQGAPQQPQAGAPPQQGAPQKPQPQLPVKAPAPQQPKPEVKRKRTTKVNRIKHYTITSNEILSKNDIEGEDFPGKYIPIVLITGQTLNVEGKIHVKGLVKDARDAQRMVNYSETVLAEAIGSAPKAPWVGVAEQFEGQEEAYRQANVKNFPYLTYKPVIADNGQLIPPPQRQPPGSVPAALFTQASRAQKNLESVIGLFGPDVGEVGPERTGAAVDAKQRPGDISTYVYSYNLNRGIEHSGKIINEIIPWVYDSERDARLRNVDDTEMTVPVNTTAGEAYKKIRGNPRQYKGLNTTRLTEIIQRHGKGARFNDITVGKYDVVITVGASYATQRQETTKTLQSMVQAMPQAMSKVLPILFENMDFKDADRCASLFRRTAPAGLYPLKEGETPFQSPTPPAVQVQLLKAKTEMAKEITQQLKSKVEMVRLYKETQETEKDIRAQILKALAELNASQHPADQMFMNQDQGVPQ